MDCFLLYLLLTFHLNRQRLILLRHFDASLSSVILIHISIIPLFSQLGTFKRAKIFKFNFIPLAADILGGWHREANEQVTKLAVAKARQIGEMEDVTTRKLRHHLSLLLCTADSHWIRGAGPEQT